MHDVRSKWAWPFLGIGIALAYFLTGRLCITISAEVANVSWVLYIPAGLSLLTSLFWGVRVAPAIFVGELGIALVDKLPLTSALLMAAGNGIDAALAGWWFHDRLGRRLELDRLTDVVQLILAELLLLQPFGTAMGMLALETAGLMKADQLWSAASAWYAANVFAQFVTVPVAIAWSRWRRPVTQSADYGELAALTTLTLLVGAFGPGRWAISGLPLPVALICAFPLLVWAAVRFVPSVPVTLGSVLGLFAFDAVLAGGGPLRDQPPAEQMFYLNVFMGVCLATSLFLAAAMGQQRRFEAEQKQLIDQLQEKAQHVKRMEEFVTFCAWTGRVRWNNDWISVEQFLRERYNVSVSHGISDQGLQNLLKDLPPDAKHGQPPIPPSAS